MTVTKVDAYCPACGLRTVTLGQAGNLYCRWAECPDQSAVHTILSDRETEHIVYLGLEAWTIRHPLRERINDALLRCQLNDALRDLAAPVEASQWRLTLIPGRDGTAAEDWVWERAQ